MPKKPRTSSTPSLSKSGKAVSPNHLRIDSSCPKTIRTAITDVLVKAAAQNKKPWQLAYPWVAVKWKDIYRAHWRLYMEFRPIFSCWAFYAPLEFNETATRFNLKARSSPWIHQSLHRDLGLLQPLQVPRRQPILVRRNSCQRSSQVRTNTKEYTEYLAKLYKTRRPRYKFIIDHALDPSYIDDFGYRNLLYLLESTGAMDPDADPESRLSDKALANIRQDMMSKLSVPAEWIGNKNIKP
ncbi:hypothetical protein V7S43_018882 [Phytophthora oleae]|uniref:PiggyBac transposable element-derived protein domain-containing protein n=1 Tax=Phytophthora oleae TaxID=2107226 RepID=A0ABD3EPF9_9STRA